MKQFLLFSFCFSMAALSVNATIRTVSNTPSTLAQFNTIQAAVDASSSGDTIYVNGSPNTYSAFSITNKQLVVIGPGWSPDKQLPLTAFVNGCTITGAACSNSEFQGIAFTSTITLNASKPDNIRFIRNWFIAISIAINQSSTTYSGYLFEGNLFDNASADATTSSTYQNFLFQNNYFYENACCRSGNINGFFNSINVLLNHNLWFGPSSATTRDAFVGTCRFLTITNNIFVKRNASTQNSSSTFNNNITFNAGDNTPWLSNGNVNSGGNISNQDPQMTDQTSVNAGSNNPLLDFTIAAGPANNAGSDGKDIGFLYDPTGSLNWTISRTSRLPYIFSMNISNPTIASGGTLNVSVEARKNN
ncbi:MAG: hypothetical protein ABJA78_10510 [Ferruginibacter sp.]